MQETQVRSLDPEDPLEEGMAVHSSILAWRIPRDEGTRESDMTLRLDNNNSLGYSRTPGTGSREVLEDCDSVKKNSLTHLWL